MIVLEVVFLAGVLSGAAQGALSPRLAGGISVDTFRRFPHHVSIRTIKATGEARNCSGSILSDTWVLSSIGCVIEGDRYQLDFHRLFLSSSVGSFSVLLDNSHVFVYPTQYDDLALIRLPVRLVFSASIKPIALFKEDVYVGNQFAVMPGFSNNKSTLAYGMFRISAAKDCLNPNSLFDEYLQICARGWYQTNNLPCEGDEGAGLIVGWPANPRLIGVFSTPTSCTSHRPAVYMRVSRYIQWIHSITGNLELVDSDMRTISEVPTLSDVPAKLK